MFMSSMHLNRMYSVRKPEQFSKNVASLFPPLITFSSLMVCNYLINFDYCFQTDSLFGIHGSLKVIFANVKLKVKL
jgi:hypothetical protein